MALYRKQRDRWLGLAVAGLCIVFLALPTAAIAQTAPPKPESRDQAEQAIGAIKNDIAVGKWKTTTNKDGSTSYTRTDAGHVGEQGGTYAVQKDGTIVHSWENLKSNVTVTYLPNGDIRREYRSTVPTNRSSYTALWKSDGSFEMTETRIEQDGTSVTTSTVKEPDGSGRSTVTTQKPGQLPTTVTHTIPPTKTASETPTQQVAPTAPTQPAAPTQAIPPSGTATPGTIPSSSPTPSTTVPTFSGFYFGFDAFAVPLRRDVVFSTPGFTSGGITFPGSSSTITHRTAGFAPMLDISYETPAWLANAPADFAFGTRFGGYVTGGDREEEFGSRISTSGNWIINPFVQYRPRVANLWTLFFEGGAWVEDDCFSEHDFFSDDRIRLHGFSAAPEVGIGAAVPLPWANLGRLELHGGLHWIGPSSIREQMPLLSLPSIDQTIELNRRWTIAGELGIGYKF